MHVAEDAAVDYKRQLERKVPNCCWLLADCWLAAGWLAAGRCLLAAGCWLLAAGCWLLVAGCWLLLSRCLLLRTVALSLGFAWRHILECVLVVRQLDGVTLRRVAHLR